MIDTTRPSTLSVLPASAGVVICLALGACGEDASTAKRAAAFAFANRPRVSQTIHEDIVKLIPRNASRLIHVRTPERLQTELARIAKSIAPGFDKFVDIVPLIARLGLRPRDLDLQRPGAIVLLAMPMIGGSFPMFALPMRDVEDAADLVEGEATISGEYLAIGISGPPKLARKRSPLADDFPAGDVAVRLSLLKVLQPFREAIQKYLNPEFFAKQRSEVKPDRSSLESMRIVLDGVKGLLGTARVLDVGAGIEAGAIDLDVILEVAKGSTWDQGNSRPTGELVHLARCLPIKDASVVLLSTPVWSKWMDSFRSVYQDMANRMAAGEGQAFAAMVNRTKAIYDQVQVGVAAAFRCGPGGARAAIALGSDTPQALVEQFTLLCNELDPAGAATAAETTAGPPSITRRSITVAPEQLQAISADPRLTEDARQLVDGVLAGLLGKGQLDLAMAIEDQRAGIFWGDPEAAATEMFTALRSDQPATSGLLATILPKLHAAPELLIACDVRQTLRDLRASMSEDARIKLPEVADGDPVLVWLALSSSGTRYEIQVHVDVVELIGLFR